MIEIIIFCIVFVAVLGLSLYKFISGIIRTGKTVGTMTKQVIENGDEIAENLGHNLVMNKKHSVNPDRCLVSCEYCGSTNDANSSKCCDCGAPIKS